MLLKKALILPGHNLSTPKEGSSFHLAFLDFKNIPTLSHCSPENPQGLTFDCQKRMSESFTKENLKKRRQAQLVFQAREENQHTEIIMSEKSFIDANDLIWPNLKIDNISIENKPVNQTNSKFGALFSIPISRMLTCHRLFWCTARAYRLRQHMHAPTLILA